METSRHALASNVQCSHQVPFLSPEKKHGRLLPSYSHRIVDVNVLFFIHVLAGHFIIFGSVSLHQCIQHTHTNISHVQIGDVVETVNGSSVQNMKLAQISDLIRGEEGEDTFFHA